jgi:hypothetical protein
MPRLSAETLDAALALQLTVAWAGEKNSRPPRLGWWRTDILDEAGARDLLSRLTPRTQEWAALEAVREAARRVDERARLRSATPDRIVTLFHFGFELDEQLGERLAGHKRSVATPADAVGKLWGLTKQFEAATFEGWCKKIGPRPKTEDAPEGRRLVAPPADPLELARAFVSSLVPFTSEYPMPHARVER